MSVGRSTSASKRAELDTRYSRTLCSLRNSRIKRAPSLRIKPLAISSRVVSPGVDTGPGLELEVLVLEATLEGGETTASLARASSAALVSGCSYWSLIRSLAESSIMIVMYGRPVRFTDNTGSAIMKTTSRIRQIRMAARNDL